MQQMIYTGNKDLLLKAGLIKNSGVYSDVVMNRDWYIKGKDVFFVSTSFPRDTNIGSDLFNWIQTEQPKTEMELMIEGSCGMRAKYIFTNFGIIQRTSHKEIIEKEVNKIMDKLNLNYIDAYVEANISGICSSYPLDFDLYNIFYSLKDNLKMVNY